MSKLDLPESWAESTIRDVVRVEYGKGLPERSRKTGEVQVLASGGIVGTHTEQLFDEPIVVTGRKGSIGAVYYVSGRSWVIDTAFALIPHRILNPKFLYWLLRGFNFKSIEASTAIPSISREALYDVRVPICPAQEQERIVAKIESTQEKIKNIEQSVTKAEELIGKYREALLQKAFRGELVPQDPNDEPASKLLERIRADRAKQTDGKKKKKDDLPPIKQEEIPFEIPKSWEWVRLGDIFSIGTGATPRKAEKKYYLNGTIPWVRTTEVQYNIICETEFKITNLATIDTNAKIYPKGSLLMAMYGEGKTRGQVAILGIDASTNQACAIMHSPRFGLSVEYVFNYLRSIYNEIRLKAEGGTQANLNLQRVGSIVVPLPPQNEQKRIVDNLNKGIAKAASLHSFTEQLTKTNNTLANAILSEAFKGRLVPQDATEGTGHDLLDKIQSQSAHNESRAATEPKAKPKKRVKP